MKKDIKKRITFAQLLSLLHGPYLSEEGIEIVVYHLEDEEDVNRQINAARALKENGKIVLSIGLLPFSFENEKTIHASLERAQLLQRASDGCILFNKDAFINGECNPEDVSTEIELTINDIEDGLWDILRGGTLNIDSETIREALRDCGTFMVTYGEGAGNDRVGLAFRNAYDESRSLYEKFDLSTARTLIIKVLLSEGDTLSNAEQDRFKQLILNLPKRMNIIFGIGTKSDLEAGQIHIVMLGTGVDAVL